MVYRVMTIIRIRGTFLLSEAIPFLNSAPLGTETSHLSGGVGKQSQ